MIVGFSLEHAEADKQSFSGGNFNINYRHTIAAVEEADIDAVQDTVARIRFTFEVSYQREADTLAAIEFEGIALWQDDADTVIEQWDENEEMPEDVSNAVANHIYRKCLTQAVGLADALELPSPVPMPQMG